MKLKCGNDVIDVPERKVAYFEHMGYVKVENESPSKKPTGTEGDLPKVVSEKLADRKVE